jgi:hypothetical protein
MKNNSPSGKSKPPSAVADIGHSDLLKELFYNPDTGLFSLPEGKKRRGRVPSSGHVGDLNYDGYVRVSVLGRRYYAHRLAWFYVHGVWPTEQLDHRNGVRDDNRIANLREATQAENGQNKALQRNNTSGVTGVYWLPSESCWRAKITVNRTVVVLGSFKSLDAAAEARARGKEMLHTFEKKQSRLSVNSYKRAWSRMKKQAKQ